MASHDAIQKITDSIRRGNCCLVVGPRYRGKSKLVRRVAKEMAETGYYRVAYISMGEITQADTRQFYRALYHTIKSQILGLGVIVSENIHSASDFRNAMLELMPIVENNLLLLVDDLELAPPNLISLLLSSIRSIFTTLTNQPGSRFQAIVSGTVNLHQLALKGVSRFESISDLILLDDMTLEEAHVYATKLFLDDGIHPSTNEIKLILEQTNSDPVLIKLLTGTCIDQIKKQKAMEMTSDVLSKAMVRVLKNKPNFEIAEALSQIESDPELLSCFLEIAQKGEVQVNELPLRIADTPNALDLCGVFSQLNGRYCIKSPLWLSILERHFSLSHCGRLYAIAGYWDKAIEYYGKAIHKDKIDKKFDLFGVTINGMQASADDHHAMNMLAQGLRACYPHCEIGIYLRTKSVLRLIHFFPGKNTGSELPKEEIPLGEHSNPEVEALEGPDYSVIFRRRKARFLIPLRVHTGAYATGLVSYCGGSTNLNKYKQHEEIFQLIGFLHQAARAIDSRQKYSTALKDAKSHTQTLESLDYILTSVLNHLDLDDEVIFRLLLAGLTANECLGFNRAALFLRDEYTGELVGTMGVGHSTWEQADSDWKNFPFHSLDELLAALISPNYQYSPLHSIIKSIRFPVSTEDIFGKVYKEGIARRSTQLAPIQMDEIPHPFLDAMAPAKEFAVAPLTAGTRRLGLVYVDNKHTHKPIDGFQMASLTGFLTQANLVMELARSLRVEKQQREQEKHRLQLEETLRDVSLIIGGSLELKEVLHRILEEMRKVLPFDTASIQLANEETHSLNIIADTGFDDPVCVKTLTFPLGGDYPNVRVYQQKEPLHFDDIRVRFSHFSDPHYQATHVHGWLGAPLIINNKAIGVITLDSETTGIYTAEHDRMAMLFAGQASMAIENARLFETEKKAENNLQLMLDTVNMMSSIDNSEAGLYSLAERIVKNQPVTFCSIFLLDESAQNLVVKVVYPILRPSREMKWGLTSGDRIPLTIKGLMNNLLNLPEPQVFKQGQTENGIEVVPALQEQILLDEEIRSILVVPLRAGNKIFGICLLGEMRAWERNPFDKDKVELITSVVAQGTVLVDRIQSYEATKNKLLMMERLRSIGEDLITASPDTSKGILDQVVRAACDVTGANSAVIYPWNRETWTYDIDKIAHFGLRTKKSFSEKIRDEEGSMTNIVVKMGMVIVDDVQQGADRSGKTRIWAKKEGFLKNEGVQAFVGVSLQGGKNALGVLFVNFLGPHYFSRSELEAVKLFANQAVIAIENARLYKELALKLDESWTLQKVGTLLTETRDSKLVLDQVIQAALGLIHADAGNIVFYDKNKDEFIEDALMSTGLGQPLLHYKTRVRQREGYSYEIIQNAKPIHIDDTNLDPRINPVTLAKGRKAVMGVPLIGREGPVGVLWVNWKTSHLVLERDERLLMALASQAAVSIENVNLFNQLKAENVRRNEESQALQEIGISLTETIELEEILSRVLRAALRLTNGDEVSILFYDESRDEFDSKALMCKGIDQPLQIYQSRVRQRTGLAYQIVQGRKPEFIPDTHQDPRISQVAIDKGRRAIAGVPLLDNDGPVGVLWVNWRAPRQVSTGEVNLLIALASQATVAIKGARRYEELQKKTTEIQRRSAHLQAVHEAGKVITAASIGLDKQQILDRILEQAIGCVSGVGGSKASVGTIQILENNELVVESMFPLHYSQQSIAKFNHIPLDPQKLKGRRVGVTGRAAITRRAQLVADVNKDEDYIVHNDETKSELAVPLLDGDRLIGILDVESDNINAFDEEDLEAFLSLVAMAVVALKNAEQYNEMEKTKDYLLTSQAVAWLGLFGADLQHTIHQKAFSLDNYVSGLRLWHERLDPPPAGIKDVLRILDGIEAVSNNIRAVQFISQAPVAIPGKAGAQTMIDEELPVIIEKLGSVRPDVIRELGLHCPKVKVMIAPEGLRVALEKLVNNALKAMPDGGYLRIYTEQSGSIVNIKIQDTGHGIPEDALPYFLRRVVPRKNKGEGTGTGVLIARFVALSHGGDLGLVSTSTRGTELCITLPITEDES